MRWGALAVTLLACDPAVVARDPTTNAKVAALTVPAVVAPVIVIAPAADLTPFHREADLAVKMVPGKLKKTQVPLEGSSAGIFTPDGKTYFVDAHTPTFNGGSLVSEAHPKGINVAVPSVHEAGFSPSGKRMYLLDDDADEVSVITVVDGSLVGKWPGVFVARFLGEDTLVIWHKCKLMRVDLTHPTAEPAQIGPETCGAADASDDGKTWVVASPSTYPVIVSARRYKFVQKLDAETGAVTPLASGEEDPITDVRLSPPGQRVCFRAKGVECLELHGSVVSALPKPHGDPFSMRWDLAGEQFLTTAAGDLIWVDIRTRAVRTISLGQDVREWGFLPDGKRIFAYDKGAWIVDLTTGEATEIYPKEVQVGVFAPSPKGDHFLVGRVVGTTAREIDLVELQH